MAHTLLSVEKCLFKKVQKRNQKKNPGKVQKYIHLKCIL